MRLQHTSVVRMLFYANDKRTVNETIVQRILSSTTITKKKAAAFK